MAISLFGSSKGQSDDQKGTTKGLYFGSPEAEAETSNNARIFLGDVFQDYLKVIPELEHEKFIVTGRKGVGKTAIAESIRYQASTEANRFCKLIKNIDLDLEATVQDADGSEVVIRKQLFEWIILTNLVSLILENEALKQKRDLGHLHKFINKNRGHVEIDEYELKSIVEENKMLVDITYFKRFFKARFSDRVGITAQNAPFYKLIKQLRRSVVSILRDNIDSINNNSYALIFDDLDINFDSSREEDIDLLLSLLRVAKNYNNEIFGKHGINAKIIVLLRTDIQKLVISHAADSSKIFSSYGVNLKWYEHITYKNSENEVRLKQFINDRIRKCFQMQGRNFDESDPWRSLVRRDHSYEEESGFKYILDHTFYRPRDLILFFAPIRQFDWPIPLQKSRIDDLIVRYSDSLVEELKNELSLFYKSYNIEHILQSLRNLIDEYRIEYSDIKSSLLKNGFDQDPDRAIERLFDYSVIGNIDDNNYVKLKHRERPHERYTVSRDERFLISYPIEAFLKRRPHS
jgi:hypothetical protein